MDNEYRQHLLNWAIERVKPQFRDVTWQAFWRTAVNHESIDEVAQELGLSKSAVYVARSRVSAKIRTEIEAIEGEQA